MVNREIKPADRIDAQRNLIRSHAAGAGPAIGATETRAVLFCRLASLSRGASAVSPEALDLLCELLNHDILPVIPEHGGVGASGDLVQLAHLALCLIGEGEVLQGGERRPTLTCFQDHGIRPLALQFREGLALMNGTSGMTGLAATILHNAGHLLDWAIRATAVLSEIVGASGEFLDERLHRAKFHPGQIAVAERLRALLRGSGRIGKPAPGRPLQEVYSIRCAPQILGPILDTIRLAEEVIADEMNAVSDNPLFFDEAGDIVHGGNFHGDYAAWEIDKVKMALTKLTMLADRQLNFLLNDDLNRILPPFLNRGRPGIDLGLQGIQFVATSTTSESQTLSYPATLHSIPSNKDNQDIVSMGFNAALLARRVALNLSQVLAILWIALAEASDILALGDQLSPAARVALAFVRDIVAPVTADRSLAAEAGLLAGALLEHAAEAK